MVARKVKYCLGAVWYRCLFFLPVIHNRDVSNLLLLFRFGMEIAVYI